MVPPLTLFHCIWAVEHSAGIQPQKQEGKTRVCSPMWVSSPQRAISEANLPRVSFLVLSSMLYKWVRTPGQKEVLCSVVLYLHVLRCSTEFPWVARPDMNTHGMACDLDLRWHNSIAPIAIHLAKFITWEKCNHKIMYDLNMGGPVRFQKQHRHS